MRGLKRGDKKVRPSSMSEVVEGRFWKPGQGIGLPDQIIFRWDLIRYLTVKYNPSFFQKRHIYISLFNFSISWGYLMSYTLSVVCH
jgi:hypothetical protein